MNGAFMKIVIGFVCKILLWRKNVFVQGGVCDVVMYTGYLTANCTARQISEVPQDLDPSIQFLFLTGNTFLHLNENSFSKYPNLVMLSLQNTAYLNQTDPINYFTFRPLQKLELIVFNQIRTPFNFSFHWPPSIRLISVNHNTFISDIDLSDLKKLEDLHALTYSIRAFPKFHKQTPLAFVDLRGNPMDSLTAEDLAPFCTLEFLSLQWPSNAIINGSTRYCQCKRLETWLQTYNIGINGPLNCTSPSDEDAEPCDLRYSEDMFLKRRECMSRLVKPSLSGWFWLFAGVILLAPLLIVTFGDTKTHQRLSRQISTTTRNPKFPKVALKINVDEDFDEEDELEETENEAEELEEEEEKTTSETKTHVENERNFSKMKKDARQQTEDIADDVAKDTSEKDSLPSRKTREKNYDNVSVEHSDSIVKKSPLRRKNVSEKIKNQNPEYHSLKKSNSARIAGQQPCETIEGSSSLPTRSLEVKTTAKITSDFVEQNPKFSS